MANTLKFGNGEWYGKKDTILAYNDENNNYKPLPFDFSRASSATRVNKDGLIETVGSGEPRVDYKDDSKGALLLEPSRTNRVPNSEDGSTWGLSNITLSSLSGGLNKEYYQITSLGSTGRFDVVKNDWINLTAGTYTASVFAKKGTCDEIILTSRATYTFQDKYSVFNLTNGTVLNSQVNGSIEPYSDGWYKCSITFTNSGSYTDFASFAFGFNFNSSSTDTLFVAAPQSEIGSYPTSYIPTQGSAVTRIADVCNNSGNEQVINSSEGVLYAEIKGFISLDTIEPNRYITLTNGTSNERIALLLGGNNNQLRAIAYSNTQSINLSFTTSLTEVKQFNKLAVKYKSGDYAFFLNGVKIGGSSETNIFSSNTFNDLSFDVGGGTQQFRGIVKDIRVYNTALTDQELQALTTI